MRARTKTNYHKLSFGNTNKYIRLRRGPKNVKCIFARCIDVLIMKKKFPIYFANIELFLFLKPKVVYLLSKFESVKFSLIE